MSIAITDIIIIAIILFFGIRSFIKGILLEVFSLSSIVVGYIVAISLYTKTAQIMVFINHQPTKNILAFLLLFIISAICMHWIGRLLTTAIKKKGGLSKLNRISGGIMGLVKGVLVICIALIPFRLFPTFSHKILKDSIIAPQLLRCSYYLFDKKGEAHAIKNRPVVQKGDSLINKMSNLLMSNLLRRKDYKEEISNEDREELNKIIESQ